MTDATETTAPEVDVAALLAENERLKGHHSKLLEETKTAKQKAAELEQLQAEAEQKRLEANQEHEKLWRQEKERADKLASEVTERDKREAQKERETKMREIAKTLSPRDAGRQESLELHAANFIQITPDGVKIMARFIRDQLEYSEAGVIGKGGKAADDVIKEMFATGDFEALRKGNQSSGGGAPGSKTGGGAAVGDMGGSKSERQAAIAKRFNLPTS